MKPSKGARARERILGAALRLFSQQGYDHTTMRDIASEAGCSLGLAYRYFSRKEELVLVVYAQVAADFERLCSSLAPGTLAQRFSAAMRIKVGLMEPYRDMWSSVFAAAVQPASDVYVLGAHSRRVRKQILQVWKRNLEGVSDVPQVFSPEDLALALFIAQLAILFFWMNDQTPRCAATFVLIDQVAGACGLVGLLAFMPDAVARVKTLADLLRPVFAAA